MLARLARILEGPNPPCADADNGSRAASHRPPGTESGEFQIEACAEAARLILLFVLNAARGRLGHIAGRGPELLAQFENEDRNGRSVH